MDNREMTIRESTDKSGNKSVTYSKQWESNGIQYSKEIKKVEGGYIVRESRWGKPADAGEEAEYIDEHKEYVTTTNPLAPKEEEKETMFDFIDTPSF